VVDKLLRAKGRVLGWYLDGQGDEAEEENWQRVLDDGLAVRLALADAVEQGLWAEVIAEL
jgi:hypothetical protein